MGSLRYLLLSVKLILSGKQFILIFAISIYTQLYFIRFFRSQQRSNTGFLRIPWITTSYETQKAQVARVEKQLNTME